MRWAITAFFVLVSGCSESNPLPRNVTFNQHIAPLLFEKCSSCHRPGEVAPFSLLTFDDARKRARQIVEVTATRYMPPWLPVDGYGEFRNDRSLTDSEVELFRRWEEEGRVEGDPADLPPMPSWTDGWQLGEPHLEVEMPSTYTLRAEGPDLFRNFVIPVPVEETRYVQGLEFRPGNREIVHHANMWVDRTGASRRRDDRDPEPGFEEMRLEGASFPDGHILGWTPGRFPFREEEGLTWRLYPETDLVLQLHLLPSGKPEPIRSSIGLFFSKTPPKRIPLALRLGSMAIDIPAGKGDYVVSDAFTLPVDVDVYGVYPHAHYLGKTMKGVARLPDGTERWLIRIDSWDFNWQDEYRYEEPLFLPSGTELTMEYTFDNSESNEMNPNHPPVRVTYGWSTSQEMADLWIQVVTRREEDRRKLAVAYGQKDLALQLAGYRKIVELNPEDYESRTRLGSLHERAGEDDAAIQQYRKALGVNENDPVARNLLGAILHKTGKIDQAIREYREALRVDAEYEEARFNLGLALGSKGKHVEAVALFKKVLETNPTNADAHGNLGAAYQALGRKNEAVLHFRRALEHRPDFPEVRRRLEKLDR